MDRTDIVLDVYASLGGYNGIASEYHYVDALWTEMQGLDGCNGGGSLSPSDHMCTCCIDSKLAKRAEQPVNMYEKRLRRRVYGAKCCWGEVAQCGTRALYSTGPRHVTHSSLLSLSLANRLQTR